MYMWVYTYGCLYLCTCASIDWEGWRGGIGIGGRVVCMDIAPTAKPPKNTARSTINPTTAGGHLGGGHHLRGAAGAQAHVPGAQLRPPHPSPGTGEIGLGGIDVLVGYIFGHTIREFIGRPTLPPPSPTNHQHRTPLTTHPPKNQTDPHAGLAHGGEPAVDHAREGAALHALPPAVPQARLPPVRSLGLVFCLALIDTPRVCHARACGRISPLRPSTIHTHTPKPIPSNPQPSLINQPHIKTHTTTRLYPEAPAPALDLLEKLLQWDPAKRPTAAEVG